MTLDSILSDLAKIDSDGVEKVASAPSKTDSAKSELVDVLKRAEAATKAASAKTASATGKPVDDLKKVASDLADAKGEALRKEAELYGAAVADGFVARLQQFEASATKTASSQIDSLQKLAEAHPDLVAQAIEVGQQGAMEHLANDEDFFKSASAGYADTMEEIEKVASDCFGQGYEDAKNVLNQVAGR